MNKRYFNFISVFLILLISCLCISCHTDTDKDGVNDDIDLELHTPLNAKVDSKGREIKEKEIGNIHFYIETSASMRGYFQNDAQFKEIISVLTTKIDKNIKPIDIWFTADSTYRYKGSTQQFSSDIATTNFANQNSSQLHKIISDIASRNASNDIAILVSDCILSFPDADIRKNKEINKTEAPVALRSNIYSTFSDLKKNGLATIIYAFNSKFYGTYYDYQNIKHLLNGTERPFYIWAIGNKDLLGKFDSQLSDINTFKPEKELHFGLSEQPVSSFDIIPQIERKGDWMKSQSGIEDVKISKNEQTQFCVAINLDNLPEYVKNIKYLQNNLQITTNGCEIGLQVKNKDDVDKSKLKSEPQIALFEKASHVIIFTLKSMNLKEADFNVTLPLHCDTWYLDWSCMDDRDISKIENKTFALEHLINGVKEAYETKNKNYIDFTIKLNK